MLKHQKLCVALETCVPCPTTPNPTLLSTSQNDNAAPSPEHGLFTFSSVYLGLAALPHADDS